MRTIVRRISRSVVRFFFFFRKCEARVCSPLGTSKIISIYAPDELASNLFIITVTIFTSQRHRHPPIGLNCTIPYRDHLRKNTIN